MARINHKTVYMHRPGRHTSSYERISSRI